MLSTDRSYTFTPETPPVNSLPIDMPWPAPKWLWAIVRLVTPVALEPLIAI